MGNFWHKLGTIYFACVPLVQTVPIVVSLGAIIQLQYRINFLTFYRKPNPNVNATRDTPRCLTTTVSHDALILNCDKLSLTRVSALTLSLWTKGKG